MTSIATSFAHWDSAMVCFIAMEDWPVMRLGYSGE